MYKRSYGTPYKWPCKWVSLELFHPTYNWFPVAHQTWVEYVDWIWFDGDFARESVQVWIVDLILAGCFTKFGSLRISLDLKSLVGTRDPRTLTESNPFHWRVQWFLGFEKSLKREGIFLMTLPETPELLVSWKTRASFWVFGLFSGLLLLVLGPFRINVCIRGKLRHAWK